MTRWAIQIKNYVQASLSLNIFFIFTGYVFLNARLKDSSGDMVLLLLLFLALPRLWDIRLERCGSFFVALFWAFLALSLASVLFPPSRFANITWVVIAQYRLLFSAAIVTALLAVSDVDRKVLRWGLAALCLALAVSYILDRQGYAVQESLKMLTPLRLDQSEWHVKNYAFWQLLLMWGSVSLLWKRSTLSNLTALVVFLSSGAAIFLSTSESSQLALVLSGAVFGVAHVVPSRWRSPVFFSLVLSTVLIPILWVCLAPLKPLLGSWLPKMFAITTRVELYDYTASLIQKELVLGYGFGSTMFMPIPQGQVGWQFCYPGGHTHNMVLQFFMDHGLLGLVFITAVLVLFGRFVYHANEDSPQAPAVWALVMSGLVLFSLSYSIWKADIVLMYCMWLALVFAVSSRPGRSVAVWLESPRYSVFFLLFGVTAVVCYAVDYLFLAGR